MKAVHLERALIIRDRLEELREDEAAFKGLLSTDRSFPIQLHITGLRLTSVDSRRNRALVNHMLSEIQLEMDELNAEFDGLGQPSVPPPTAEPAEPEPLPEPALRAPSKEDQRRKARQASPRNRNAPTLAHDPAVKDLGEPVE